MENSKELEYLLNNYWCTKNENPSLYFNIKNSLDDYKDFIRDKLGSRLIVNDRFIKLEKIPSIPKQYMGIEGFTDKLEYILLLIVLIYLEDKPKLEQFILSNLIDFISNTATTLELDTVPDWNILHHRKCLAIVIKHLSDLGIIRIVEETGSFTEDAKVEGLYETTGISNFYVREFKNNIMEYNDITDYINDEFTNQDTSIGDVRRYRVYRSLLYSLASYTEDLSEFEIDYIRKFRTSIKGEFSKYLNASLEVTKSMSLLLFDDETNEKLYFPNSKAISDIVLLVNNKILNKIEKHELELNSDETISLSKENLERIIKNVREENLIYFSKMYKTLPVDNFTREVISYMKDYDFLRSEENIYKIYPAISKMTGYIPKDEEGQLNLFESESENDE